MLTEDERNAYLHVTSEAKRVAEAVAALQTGQRERFGKLLIAGHQSLRDRLKVSCPELDQLVAIACQAGADGARLTGAGFGGFAVILCHPDSELEIVRALEERFYSEYRGYDRRQHLFRVEAASGALD